ncbi:MAG: DUF6457 domain-containing protein [Propionibacteriaceae bacterium]|jgi:hypothetical protein|nr:DUF6457 domain-containing protein [Propionibacteriaceae bacterium]
MEDLAIVEAWLDELRSAYDLEGLGQVDITAALGAVREVAHTVSHPAGPVAMLAVGYAAGRAHAASDTHGTAPASTGDTGSSPDRLDELLATVVRLAHDFAQRRDEDTTVRLAHNFAQRPGEATTTDEADGHND